MNTHVARNPIGATAGHRLPPFDFAAKPRGSCAGASTDGHSQTPNDSYLESTRLYLGKWVQVSIYLFFLLYGVMSHVLSYFGGSRYTRCPRYFFGDWARP